MKKAARPPIFEDVVPTTPPDRLRKRAPRTVSGLSSLDRALPNLPRVTPLEPRPQPLEQTRLANGVRVISQLSDSPGAVIGLALDAGTRHERAAERGATLLAERLAFKSPRQRADVARLRALGSTFSPFYGRELIAWVVECLPDHALPALDVAAAAALEPHFDADAVAVVKQDLALQIDEYRNAPAEFVPEMIHSLAFDAPATAAAAAAAEGGIGRPLLCSVRELDALSGSAAEAFLRRRLLGSNVVVVGYGVEHAALCERAERLVGSMPSGAAPPSPPSVYRGGWRAIESTSSDANLTHVAVGFEGARIGSRDSYTACVLQMLLGGGDSFSTGGPGKGMYSMLYRDVLVRYGEVKTCVAFNQLYRDTGVFGIFASAADVSANALLGVAMRELELVCRGVSDEALARAKNQLKGQVLIGVESRLVQFEDMARQMVIAGSYLSPHDVCQHIDRVTAADLANFVLKALPRPSYLKFGPKALIQDAPSQDGK